jgi:hypothetical protein
LKREQFIVTDTACRRRSTSATLENVPLAITLLLDTSESMRFTASRT